MLRRKEFAMEREDALAFLRQATELRIATTREDGVPVLRTVNPVVVGDRVFFHGSPSGEKTRCIGREAVLQADEVVAMIPSYFVDPERACPATTFYRSVQVRGRLERIEDPEQKAEVLERLMNLHQPEGGHAEVRASSPLYANAVRGLWVVGVRLDEVTGKCKLGQGRKPDQLVTILERLWERGEPGDPRAIEMILAANPGLPRPGFLCGPDGARLVCALHRADVDDAVRLLEDAYWNRGVPREAIARAQLGSTAWVGARNDAGALIATARANSDASRHAFVADVAVAPVFQRRGLGRALVGLLLNHPKVRHAGAVRLGTVDAAPFYERFGFVDERTVQHPYPVTRMLLRR
jgi:nitroimidazol reductase NimA-like FMN-containing flavoprotein (pyridoxamine 5'-phosphate oxidase superfamily)/predicted N-acetyltransferase YhbS